MREMGRRPRYACHGRRRGRGNANGDIEEGPGSVSAKAPRRRSPGKAKPVRPRRAVAMFGRVSAKPVTSFTLVEAAA
jgi:hypothetical protein